MVDRYNRKLIMMVNDLATGLGTTTIYVLMLTDNLQVVGMLERSQYKSSGHHRRIYRAVSTRDSNQTAGNPCCDQVCRTRC